MPWRWLRILLVVAFLVTPAGAEELRLIPGERRIAPRETAAFEFGTVPQRDTTILLNVTARLHLARPSGSMYFLKMELNGREIRPARSRRVGRLVGRSLEGPVHGRGPVKVLGLRLCLLSAPPWKQSPHAKDTNQATGDCADGSPPSARRHSRRRC